MSATGRHLILQCRNLEELSRIRNEACSSYASPEFQESPRLGRQHHFVGIRLLLWGRCDSSFVPDPGPAPDLIQSLQVWYEAALLRYQEELAAAGVAKTGDEIPVAVLAALVRAYPPDWSQAVAWRDSNGGAHVATLLGPERPAVSFSHDGLAVVRTLIGDFDAQGEVTGARLVEFISPDPLDPLSYVDYLAQWIHDDFGEAPMLAAEYTIGYATQGAWLHRPGEATPVPQELSLDPWRAGARRGRESGGVG